MLMSFKDYFDKQVSHRHRHPVVRDPSTRKFARTVPEYIRPKNSPKKYNDFKNQKNSTKTNLSNTDTTKLQSMFNVKDLPVGKVKGLKRTGVGLKKTQSGRIQLVKTK